ncbi:MAG TPA: EAL domain-containing protein [Aliidongia sp.]|uniref:putative bifunctional diguanylate cyclase/phosphodiesterase n=1 Tax=Aliidongia sp. TaxID=1914230 RepID=UPI002DDD20B3|nr:EAL domain-containing protein [Aliidongia sp.]HEV2673148.1 EAL domain-containing protein [Aliidongia sp.]
MLLAFLGMSAITGALGVWGTIEIREVGQLGIETYDRPLMAINYARAANTMFEQMGNPMLDGKVSAPDADDPEESFFEDLDVAEARASSPEAAAEVRHVRTLAQAWLSQKNTSGDRNGGDALRLSNELRAGFDRLIEKMAADGFANRQQTTAVTGRANRTSGALTIAAILVSLVLAFFLSRRIVRPLSSAAAVADRIASGELDAAIPPGGTDEAGALLGSMTVMQQRISQMVAKEKTQRRFAEGRLVEALESSTEAMMLLDREGIILVCNSRVEELLGHAGHGVKDGDRFVDTVAGGDAARAARLCVPGELQLADGRWLKISREETVDGNAFLIWSDITLQKNYERKLEATAYEDPLTGVNNRNYFLQLLDGLPTTAPHAVVVVNIDRFRRVNNAYGSRIADRVLIEIAHFLRTLVGPDENCARIGADEFAMLLDATDPARAARLTDRLAAAFPMVLSIEERTITIDVSVGFATSEPEGSAAQDLLTSARAAHEQAKRAGGGRIKFFDATLREESRSRLLIESDLPDAIRNRDIQLHYQPLIDLKSGRLSGFEALARWMHPQLGQIPPGRFIPIAEESRAILDLGKYVLDAAANQAKNWVSNRTLDQRFTVAVNLSPRQIADPTNAREILHYLDRDPAAAHLLKLEVTEGVLLDDPAGMVQLLRDFKGRGVELSLDDFGTGFSSLSYLHRFPFDVLKIDRSFVIEIVDNPDALRLVQTIIELGQDLGLELVAEGVETAEQAKILQSLGCDIGQGYYFSRPVNLETATLLFDERRDWTSYDQPDLKRVAAS